MYYRILETDEMIGDLSHISFAAYDYTRDRESGIKFLELYDLTIANLAIFPTGYSGVSMEYRGYEIHILPFGNYNMFFILDETKGIIVMLRCLYQKQDWQRILQIENKYHYQGKKF